MLAMFAQFWWFRGEQDFYCYANRQMKGYFPHLPDRAQFNRMVRQHWHTNVTFWQAQTAAEQQQLFLSRSSNKDREMGS